MSFLARLDWTLSLTFPRHLRRNDDVGSTIKKELNKIVAWIVRIVPTNSPRALGADAASSQIPVSGLRC